MTELAGGGTDAGGDRWGRALERVLRGDGLALAFQPIVDVQHAAVVGYEALSRFDGSAEGIPPTAPPAWFAAAKRLGVLEELEARVLSRALDARDRLPPNTFLTVNVSPLVVDSAAVSRVLLSPRGLHRVVVEITEEAMVEDYASLARAVASLRSRGAYLAVDDAGAGYASLSHVLALRPDFVKLDQSLVSGLAEDEAKLALVEMFGQFAGRIDSWLLAEGVETASELAALSRMGVPLAQGYLMGRPGPDWAPLPEEIRQLLLRAVDAGRSALTVERFVEPWPFLEQGLEVAGLELAQAALSGSFGGAQVPSFVVLPVLDGYRRPVGLFPVAESGPVRPPMVLKRETRLADAARRAITRPLSRRFDPLVVVDDLGDYLGVVRLERVIESLSGQVEALSQGGLAQSGLAGGLADSRAA